MGVDVTVVEVMDRILPVEDEEISTFARKSFEKQGLKIITGATVKKLDKEANSVTATIEQGGRATQSTCDRVIMAVGIVGNTENLGLENTKVKIEKNQIKINEWCATDEPGVYAIGDVCGAPWLAHKASHEGVICVEKIAGVKDVHPLDFSNIPGCTYCQPQVASVGMTEAKAKAAGYSVKVGRFPFVGNGKAIALGTGRHDQNRVRCQDRRVTRRPYDRRRSHRNDPGLCNRPHDGNHGKGIDAHHLPTSDYL